MQTNEKILKAAAVDTTDLANGGALSPEQSRRFIEQTFEKTALGGLIRRQMRRAKSGQIDKIGIATRILRGKVEGVDAQSNGGVPIVDPDTGEITGYRAKPIFSNVPYATTAVRLPWEITNDTLRENIQGESLAATITDLMTKQLGCDLEDLYLNGDTATPGTDPDHDFLCLNDGWVKQISGGGHVVDATGTPGGLSIDLFYNALKALPNKYNDGKLRWLMSPHNAQNWELYLLNQGLQNGGSFPDSLYKSPASIPSIAVPSLPDSVILLTNPQNLIVVNTYDVVINKTTEGKEAVMRDMRFYCAFVDFDPIIEELDATAIIENIGGV